MKLQVDFNVLKKYDLPGPRYTSYPPAPHFTDAFDSEDYETELASSNRGSKGAPISLYFHLPFCPSRCFFCGCNVTITRNRERIKRYLDYLKKEISLTSKHLSPNRKVVQIHWGGGTPTYLFPEETRELYQYIHDHFNVDHNAEVSIEIDPRGLTPTYLPLLRGLGFNRVSFGIQDFNPAVQKAVCRVQSTEENNLVVRQSRELEFDSINIDLIYGLPHQTEQSFAKTIDQIIDIFPDRLAIFQYAHVPWMKPHQKAIPEEALPSAEERLKIKIMLIEKLSEAGYVYIGMDHFAKPNDSLSQALSEKTLHRNFQGYTTHAEAEIIAMGMTSISQLHNIYAQNAKTETAYMAKLDQNKLPTQVGYRLSEDDQIRRYVITELMCNNRLLKEDVEERFGINFDSYFQKNLGNLGQFVEDNLLYILDNRLEIPDKGRLVSRNIAMAFDPYLEKTDPNKPTYSRTV